MIRDEGLHRSIIFSASCCLCIRDLLSLATFYVDRRDVDS
jgi:hypothetical protein